MGRYYNKRINIGTDYERQRKIILSRGGDGSEVLQLYVEGRAAEHNRGGCSWKKQEGERPADKEHRRGIARGTWLHRFHVRRDDAQVATSDKVHDESRQADAGDLAHLPIGAETSERRVQERAAGAGDGGRKQERNMSGL